MRSSCPCVGRPRPAAALRAAPARRARAAPPPRVAALFGFGKAGKGEAAEAEGDTITIDGFRYDQSMQRWVRDARVKGAKVTATVRPMSGVPYTIWPLQHAYLVQNKLRSVPPEEAARLLGRGALLLDVRLPGDFAGTHAAGAVNVPAYRLTAGGGAWDNLKILVMRGLNQLATERDPDFAANVEAAAGGRRRQVVVYCSLGGTLDTVSRNDVSGKRTENDPDKAFGRESRSLKACYELKKAGFSNVVHLEGGMQAWRRAGLGMESG